MPRPRTGETASTNPTGIPMRLESGIWMPGETTATNINNNNQILRNTSSPKVEIGDVGGGSGSGGGEGRSIPVIEAGAPASGAETPSPAEATVSPEVEALRQEIAQLRAVIETLVQRLDPNTPGEQAAAADNQATDNRRPASEVWDEAHAENARIDQERAQAGQDPAETRRPASEVWDEAHAENARIDQERAQAEDTERRQRAEQAKEALDRARDDLVRMTILRRARSISALWHRGEADAYNRAYENYRNALRESMAAQAEVLRAAGRSDEEIIAQLGPQEYAEQRAFAERVHSMDQEMYENGQKSFKDRMLKRWANYSTKKKLIIGLAAGLGVGFGAGAVLGAGVAAAAVGLAARYSVGILNHVASARNVSEKSKNAEVARIKGREQREIGRAAQRRLRFAPTGQTVDQYLDNDMYNRNFGNRGYHNRERMRAQSKNWFGLALLGASGALVGSELAGVHLLDHIPTGPIGHWLHEAGEKIGIGGDYSHSSEGGFNVPGHGTPDFSSWDVKPSTIHAGNMTEFNKGVVSLLQHQGVQIHGLNQHVLDHMNHYMENRPMASGMAGPHVQHLVSGEYSFGNPSGSQGFEIGASGTGKEELLKWMNELSKQPGVSVSRS